MAESKTRKKRSNPSLKEILGTTLKLASASREEERERVVEEHLEDTDRPEILPILRCTSTNKSNKAAQKGILHILVY